MKGVVNRLIRFHANIRALERIKQKQVIFISKIDAILSLVRDFALHRIEVHIEISVGITNMPASVPQCGENSYQKECSATSLPLHLPNDHMLPLNAL